jgi:membrane protein DedA with SNARE-associated domain
VIGFLTHLNGALATSLLCTLLFVDELGVPLPLAPNEVLLLIGGLLVASGVLVPWLFLPLAFLAMVAGMLTAFAWARTLGSDRLHDLAERIDAERPFERALRRVRSASVGGIALARLLPGVRVYATLAGGASGIQLRRFLIGAVPALVVWVAALVLIGDLVGRPAEGLISRVDNFILTGALLIVLGVGSFLVVRRVPRDRIEDDRMNTLPRSLRYLLALAVDVGIVGSIVTGLAGVAGHFLHLLREVNGVVGLSVVVVIGYVIAARRGAGATLGEGLFTVDFRSVLRLGRLRRRQAGTDRSGDGNANPAANPDPQSEVVLDQIDEGGQTQGEVAQRSART